MKHVTAVGQAAVIVSMLGGTSKKTPLVGADEELLENKGAQKVLANKGIASVKKVWKDDGTSEGDLDDVDDIVKLDPELCFVTEGEKTLTDKQEKALLKKNIIVYVLPNMKSASKISYAVELVGKILKAGGNDGAGELASDYVKWHDDLVDKLKDKNKGLTGGFNFDKGKKASSDATPLSTLYVSDWDYDAVYDDPNDYLESSQGVGIADLGYEEAPVTYYMSVGGVLNNAAAGTFRDLSGYAAPVWQFSLTKAPSAWGNWKSIDRGKASYALKGNGFDNALLWSNSESAGLGTRAFPGVVVANQKMARAMERDAGDDHGLYYPYPTAKSTHGGVITTSTVGFYTGSNLVDACIGTSGGHTRSVLNDGSDVEAYDIHVNPSGPFSSWTEGSVESVLEASWVQKTFRDSSYDLNADIEGFYSKFYDYSLASSEVDEILAGEES